jgi:hypothetical protein
VSSVSFNKEGTLLLAIGQDNNNQHTIWKDVGGQWSRTQQVGTEKGDQNPVLFSNWIKDDQTGGCGFVSGGGKAILFWKLEGSVSFYFFYFFFLFFFIFFVCSHYCLGTTVICFCIFLGPQTSDFTVCIKEFYTDRF